MNNLNLIPITELQALRLVQDRKHPPVYADKNAEIKLKFHDRYNVLVEVERPYITHLEPYYIPQVSPATKTYLQRGKWDASKLQRKALTLAAKINPLVKLQPLDALEASPFRFYKPAANKYGLKTVFMLDGTIADLHKLATKHNIAIKEIPNARHAAMRVFSFGDYLIYCNKTRN